MDLYNNNFVNGTIRLTSPGVYTLKEDIIFSPNSDNDYRPVDPISDQSLVLGFFAAITIESPDVTLDLNGFCIRQSLAFNTQQRFWSAIELAGQPFLHGQGPADFGPDMAVCSNVVVKNGSIRLSSHHGIHGSLADNVVLENLEIYDHEVAAIQLNGCTNVTIRNITIDNTYANVKVNSRYSQARFILPFAEKVPAGAFLTVNGVDVPADQILLELRNDMENTLAQILAGDEVTSPTFKNLDDTRLSDGCCYGIVLNVKGVAVGNFMRALPAKDKNGEPYQNKNIVLSDIKIQNTVSRPHEILSLSTTKDAPTGYNDSTLIKDAVGAIFRFQDVEDDDKYDGNLLSNVQLLTAKYFPKAGVTNIPQPVLDWAAGKIPFSNLLFKYYYVNDGDMMGHHMKGNIGLFLSGVYNCKVCNIKIDHIENKGAPGHSAKKYPHTYLGANAYGLAIVCSEDVWIIDTNINNIRSHGQTAGTLEVGENINVVNHATYQNIVVDTDYVERLNNPTPVAYNVLHLTNSQVNNV